VPVDAGAQFCQSGSVTLELKGSGTGTDYCIGADCSWEWLTISTKDGQVLARSHECISDCTSCMPVGCPGSCAAPRQIQPDGEMARWDGTYWVGAAACGNGLACAAEQCAPPGRYVAKMCAYANQMPNGQEGVCSGAPTPTCVTVEFDLPSPDVVVGLLGPGQ
jgi:hypothetical protein